MIGHGPRDPRLDPYDLDAGTEEHYVDAALYDYEYRRRRADVNHYRALAKEHARKGIVLELACGSGRVLGPLVRDGHRAIGVDLSAAMLQRAAARLERLSAARRERVLLVRADMRRYAFGTTFPLILCPFNAFQHLYTRTDVEAFLASVAAHLAPDGRLAFDVLNPDLAWLTRDPHKRWARTKFHHPETGELLEYSTNQTYDPVTQIVYMRIYYESLDEKAKGKRTKVVRLSHRQFFPSELEALLAANGFAIDERWGGFDRQPFRGGSESQVLVCSRVRR
jgi:SAM-dependent methyltransferase